MSNISLPEAILRIIQDRRQVIAESMMYGNVKNMEHYRELIGNIQGITFIEQELKSLLEKQEQSDD
jgi:hypothetical protein|tara:strand:+ start:1146 stop:1343 length:198 start_codon:yes stop_codon:yes gene_type:complete